MKNLIEELRACVKMHPLDIDLHVLLEAADALESQCKDGQRYQKLRAIGGRSFTNTLTNQRLTNENYDYAVDQIEIQNPEEK